MSQRGIGDNSRDLTVTAEVRLFNTLARYGNGGPLVLTLPAGASLNDVIGRLAIPPDEIHLALVNGRDVTPRLDAPLNVGRVIEDGDVVALSGPVPYSWGYGAPVV
jgi:hypothetical protein